MYTEQQLSQIAIEHTKEIAALWESAKSAHHRIKEKDKIADGIHDLARSVAEMATEIKLLTKRMDSSIERIEQGQKEQGVRIGGIEKTIMVITRNEKAVEDHDKRLDAIEKAPGAKWDKFTWLIIAGVATAVVAFLVGKLL